jgi:excinuclease ABC subunit C
MMREALTRRFRHSAPAGRIYATATEAPAADEATRWPLPDLLVVDGGKGQLGVAVSVLNSLGLSTPIIGLAKREEEIFVPGDPNPITLPKTNYALQLLQRIRDEAHRFAITFHRSLRSKRAYSSALDTVAGIGPAKKKALIKKFGSVAGIKRTSSEEIAGVVGQKLADKIMKTL